MDRRAFLRRLPAGGALLGLGKSQPASEVSTEPVTAPDYDWIADIRHGTDYKLLKTIPRVDAVFLTPPERGGGNLRLDFINWDTYPDDEDDVLLVPAVRTNPEWHVLGPARYSVSLWMGPLRRSQTPSALIQVEAPTSVAIYTHDDRVQQVVLLSEIVS